MESRHDPELHTSLDITSLELDALDAVCSFPLDITSKQRFCSHKLARIGNFIYIPLVRIFWNVLIFSMFIVNISQRLTVSCRHVGFTFYKSFVNNSEKKTWAVWKLLSDHWPWLILCQILHRPDNEWPVLYWFSENYYIRTYDMLCVIILRLAFTNGLSG